MGCLFNLLFGPIIYGFSFCIAFFVTLFKAFFYIIFYVIKWGIIAIFKLIFIILSLIIPTNNNKSFSDISIEPSKKTIKKSKIYNSNFDEFEQEADLWGLSKEDRRIAKEERLSPADYVEAEERDDDVLDTDEWEK